MPFELSFSQHELNQVKSCMFLSKALDIDGRPRFTKLSIDNVEKVEIAAIDPDFIEAEASVPDGMR